MGEGGLGSISYILPGDSDLLVHRVAVIRSSLLGGQGGETKG